MADRSFVPFVVTCLLAAGLLAGAAALLAFGGRWWWVFGLLEHFRVVYAIALSVVAAVATIAGRRRIAILLAAVLLVNSMPMASVLDIGESGGGGPRITVLLTNLLFNNIRRQPMRDLVAEHQPDLVIAIEVTQAWYQDLDALLGGLPHHTTIPRVDCSGLGLWSRYPVQDIRKIDLGSSPMRRSLQATVQIPGAESLVVVATHPPPPTNQWATEARDEHLAVLASYIRTFRTPILVGGDLNATPWSGPMINFSQLTGLRFVGGLLGPGGSWPSPMPVVRLPIDHLLHHASIRVLDYEVGPGIGSDHRPIIVDLELPPAR